MKIIIKKILGLNRLYKQLLMIGVDSLLIIFILLISFSIRLDYIFWPRDEIIIIVFGAPFLAIPIFILFKLYHSIVRFIGSNALWSIVKASSIYALIWGLIPYFFSINGIPGVIGIPRSVFLINWMLTIIVLCGVRIYARNFFSQEKKVKYKNKTKVIIYGTSIEARELSQSLQSSKKYLQVAFLDDQFANERANINNIPVFDSDNLATLIKRFEVKEVFLALPSISRNKRNQIIEMLSSFSVHVKSLPSLSDLAGGKVKVDDLLEIDLKDLLGRDVVKSTKSLLKVNISKKVVLVTGAGGSIGSELSRQILSFKPKKIVLYDISESALYQIDQELRENLKSDIEVFPIIGSVSDKDLVLKVIEQHDIQTIYHAAAYKHVPLLEYNQTQAILNNTIGTKILAEAAIISNVETFVLVSTDKAVRPTNFMGASKRAAEMVLQGLAKLPHKTCFTMVRFGNVLDSSGSVIPLFKKQIKEGGPVTVTHVDMVRYFMMIPEAVELVIQAGAMAKGGEVFVLNMGEPIRIYDLALKMINLSGLQVIDENNPEGDIEIQFSGLRPGEKLYEELLIDGEFESTDNPLIMRTEEGMVSWDKLNPILSEISLKGSYLTNDELYNLIKKIVPEFQSK